MYSPTPCLIYRTTLRGSFLVLLLVEHFRQRLKTGWQGIGWGSQEGVLDGRGKVLEIAS